jgi:RNAse (barnase) inhibitor barstar
MVKIFINLDGVHDKETLFAVLSQELIVKPWGNNWDALSDCLRDLHTGGFTNTYEFPLTIEVTNWNAFSDASEPDFLMFKEILEEQVAEYAKEGLDLSINFV